MTNPQTTEKTPGLAASGDLRPSPLVLRRPAKWSALLTWALLLGVPAARASIDFTPRTLEREEDGQRKRVTYIVPAPGQRALLTAPVGWLLSGGPAGLETHPPNSPGGSVTLRAAPRSAEPLAFDAKGLELYRRRALADVPPGSTGARIAEEHPEPLGLSGWKTHEFVITWELGGQFWQESVIFVTLGPRESMVGTAIGLRAEHPALREGLTRLLSSWSREPGA